MNLQSTIEAVTSLLTTSKVNEAILLTAAFLAESIHGQTIYEKTIDGKVCRFEPSELDGSNTPITHTIEFTKAKTDERTGGAYISNNQPSASGLCIESLGPIAIIEAKQKIELDVYGDITDPSGIESFSYSVAGTSNALVSGQQERRTIPGATLPWILDNNYFVLNYDFNDNPIISISTNTFCVPAALIPHSATLVPRSLYTTEAPVSGIKGFVWAEQALNKFEWLSDRSFRDNPRLPLLTYPAQSVSYINLKQIESPNWSTNASIVGIKADGQSLVLTFSDETLDRTVEASVDLKEWEQVYELPAHETNIVTIPYAPMKFFRVGKLQ